MYNNQENIIDWWSKESMISSWLLYMYLCFTSLLYLPDYCTCAFASPVYDIFLIIVHVPLLHQSIIPSWLLYMCLCFTSLWYLPDYCTCPFASPVYDIFLIIVHVPLCHQSMISSWLLYQQSGRYDRLVKQRYMYNNQEDIIDWWSKCTCTIIRKIS
jgi:hypothetical protein